MQIRSGRALPKPRWMLRSRTCCSDAVDPAAFLLNDDTEGAETMSSSNRFQFIIIVVRKKEFFTASVRAEIATNV